MFYAKMAVSFTTVVVLLCVLAAVITENFNPLSDEFINLINSKQNSWKAGRNFQAHEFLYIKNLMGPLEDENFWKLPKVERDAELIANLPENFDAKEKWPLCSSLNEIKDQGSCSSCWAVAAAEAMTDRYCIYSNGKQNFYFSAHDILSCCPNCGNGCQGGSPSRAWEYWRNIGIVSGGNYNSSQGCRPYGLSPCEHNVPGDLPPCGDKVNTPECVKSCVSTYNTDYAKDKLRGKHVYQVSSDEKQIKAELFKNGPVESTIAVYADFIHYKHGVYKHSEGPRSGVHSVKIIGWGGEGDQIFWLVANSWNTNWGDKGFLKMLRGEDHCSIESSIVAGEPLI